MISWQSWVSNLDNMEKIGILGGSFDPLHLGHLSIAEAAMTELNLDRIILIPTKVSPFKVGRKMASNEDRLAMARLATTDKINYQVSTIEIEGQEVSYTYDTLVTLQKTMMDTEFWFLMGSDSFMSLENWYKGKDLLREFNFAVALRPGSDYKKVKEKAEHYQNTYDAEVEILHNNMLDISSTEIKRAIKDGRPISEYVSPSIERYIDEHGLYK